MGALMVFLVRYVCWSFGLVLLSAAAVSLAYGNFAFAAVLFISGVLALLTGVIVAIFCGDEW